MSLLAETAIPAAPTPAAPTAAPAASAPSTQRLMSLDALRGFDMFWIIGANAIVYALNRMTPTGPIRFLADQLEHADWEGFHFYDLIFPLFVFLAGVSIVFSLTKTIERGGRGEALKRVFRRGILLYVIGVFYSGGFSSLWPDIRLLGVLNRIALAYLFAGLLFCLLKPRGLVAACAGLLVGYWALMTFVPIRDIRLTPQNIAQLAAASGDLQTAQYFENKGATNASIIRNNPAWAGAQKLFYSTTRTVRGKYDPGYNLANHLDFQYLPGKKWDVFFDPEGYLSTLPAIATCLLGVFAGLLLQNRLVPDQQKVVRLAVAGVVALVVGWLWNFQFPVIKKIWTSSYVLVAGGYSALLLAGFYQIVDIWKYQRWCQPFVWIGMNSITIYLTSNIIGGFSKVASRIAGGDVRLYLERHVARGFGDLVVAMVGLFLAFWFVRFLYRRKIFLRL